MAQLIDLDRLAAARAHAARIPLDAIDVIHFDLHLQDLALPYFERLRREDPVHWHADSHRGPFWSITRFEDVKFVDTRADLFSSDGSVVLEDMGDDLPVRQFIAMDQPEHGVQRKTVAPVVGPRNLAALESTIRERVVRILEALPVGEAFDWVDRVSVELTTQMLATLFDFPFEDRRKLTFWSDVATGGRRSGLVDSREEQVAALQECLETMTRLREERRAWSAPGMDLLSMLAHGEDTRDMDPMTFLGNLMLLIVGGNDTTRNSISGGVFAMNLYPEEARKLRADPSLIPNMVAETIRWQTPLTYMRRTALDDVELGGRMIRRGDKVAMWYLSANRDESVFKDGDRFLADRENARSHVSFGYGLHRCMGNRLAEMQLRVLWEEILPRFSRLEVVAPPVRARNYFVRGYTEMKVVLHRA